MPPALQTTVPKTERTALRGSFSSVSTTAETDPMSSDEEGEVLPDQVTNFHFVDTNNVPVPFCVLPLQGKDIEMSECSTIELFLHGTADNGLQKIYKKASAWRFELSYVHPEIYVLVKDNKWIKLHKPRKSYENFIRSLLVAVHFLHFAKKNPTELGEVVWSHVSKNFSTFEVVPSENDLVSHISIIAEAARRDKDIAKSKCVTKLLANMHGGKAILNEAQENSTVKRPDFVVDDDCDEDSDGDSDEAVWQLFDTVCAYCDDGGEILCCEGRCKRSFHPSIESGAQTSCESLGYNNEQPDVFLCKNCQYQQHQCFACGSLGSSDQSAGAEVFPCISATCGHFYHPKCVAKLLCPSNETQAVELEKKIAEGESFTCPVHTCCVCKEIEDTAKPELQFAICRRCPKAYHRKCLPRTIAFQSDPENNVHQRAWEGLLQNRILIYCMNHKIIPKLGTPRRDHLLFPEGNIEKKQPQSGKFPCKLNNVSVRKSKVLGSFEEIAKAKETLQITQCTFKSGVTVERSVKGLPKASVPKFSTMTSKDYQMSIREKVPKFPTVGKGHSSEINQQSKPPLKLKIKLSSKLQPKMNSEPTSFPEVRAAANKESLNQSSGRAKLEQRILDLMTSSSALIDPEKFIEEKRRTCINPYSQKIQEKTITMEKVEHAVKAMRVALKKLENGGTIDEAKKICPPEVLQHIVKWKTKLRVHLGPFLHGSRYTSFGRHFTKVDKLKEVVERLKWYVQDGDTIVDFCCGSNDFSCLMKEALEELGKRCSFKNYDLMSPKNDFNFEKRDWMSVQLEELPVGSSLIMGLNPPFGVHASLANKFINKALTFRPKILILIVPKETQRLDRKRFPYDLIWLDSEVLSGMSFYLPGSVGANNKQLDQWNMDAPPLYLWSHPDWTHKHRAIAENHGHVQRDRDRGDFEEFRSVGVQPHATGVQPPTTAEYHGHVQRDRDRGHFGEFTSVSVQPHTTVVVPPPTTVSNYLMEDKQDCFGDFSGIERGCPDISKMLDDIPETSHCDDGMVYWQDDYSLEMPWDCNQNVMLQGQNYIKSKTQWLSNIPHQSLMQTETQPLQHVQWLSNIPHQSLVQTESQPLQQVQWDIGQESGSENMDMDTSA